MTDKEIKRLRRQDLLIILAEQTEKINQLEKSLQNAEGKLKDRMLIFDECGTMAEAALRINEVFRAVDEATAQYLENVRLRQEKQIAFCEKMEAESKRKYDKIIHDAEMQAAEIKKHAEAILRDAEETVNQKIQEV